MHRTYAHSLEKMPSVPAANTVSHPAEPCWTQPDPVTQHAHSRLEEPRCRAVVLGQGRPSRDTRSCENTGPQTCPMVNPNPSPEPKGQEVLGAFPMQALPASSLHPTGR